MPRLQKSSNVSSAVRPSGTTIDVAEDVAACHAVDDGRQRRRPREAVLAGLKGRRAAGDTVVELGQPGRPDDALGVEAPEDVRVGVPNGK